MSLLLKNRDKHISEDNLPKFVKMGKGSCLRLVRQGPEHMEYWRDGGAWGVSYIVKEGKLFSVCYTKMDWLHDVPLVPVSESVWRECNGVYAPEKV